MLYHYTTQSGILGIVESSSIWATHALFLNDSSEFSHGLDFAKHVAVSIFMEDDYLGAFGWALRHGLEGIDGSDIYVSSFSETPNLLSQWRGYCPDGSGFCLGFNSESIQKYCQHGSGLRFEKCIYRHEEQVAKIKALIDECFLKFPQPGITREEYDAYSSKEQFNFEIDYKIRTSEGVDTEQANEAVAWFCSEIAKLAPLFKNEGFHEEAEWRVIVESPNQQTKFRAGKSFLVPYIEIDFLKAQENYPLEKIIVGPGSNQQRNEESVKVLLKEKGLGEVEIECSEIPYNNW